jgi:chromosome segregation ATPase
MDLFMIITLSISFLAFISAAIIKIYKSIVGFVEPKVDNVTPSFTRYDSVGSNYDINDLEAEAKEASIKAEQSKEEAAKAEMLDSDNFADLVKQADADKAEADRANKNLADARNKLDDLLDQTEADRIKADRNLADANSEIADLERRLSEAMAELEAADLTAATQEAKIRRSISSYKMKADKARKEADDLEETTTDFDKRITALTIAIKSLEIAKIEYYHLENLTGATPATATLIKNIAEEIMDEL